MILQPTALYSNFTWALMHVTFFLCFWISLALSPIHLGHKFFSKIDLVASTTWHRAITIDPFSPDTIYWNITNAICMIGKKCYPLAVFLNYSLLQIYIFAWTFLSIATLGNTCRSITLLSAMSSCDVWFSYVSLGTTSTWLWTFSNIPWAPDAVNYYSRMRN